MTELPPAVQALCDRLGAVRWLKPDAEMDTLAEGALRWIDERDDEHSSAFSRWLQGPAPSLALTVTRSLREAREKSGHARSRSELKDFSIEALHWASALETHSRHATVDVAHALGAVAVAEIQTQVWAHLRALSGADAQPAKREVGLETEYAVGVAGGEAMVAHAMLLMHDAAKASPWAPLLAMWERGLCALPALDGGMVVYVPARKGDALVADPSGEGDPNSPMDCLFSGGIHPVGPWGNTLDLPPEGNARNALKRFNRMGLGPLVGMYAPPNMAFPGVTNWPGPPDLYVVRPPERGVSAVEVTAVMHMPGMSKTFMPTPNLPATSEPFGRPVPWYRRIFGRK